MVRTSSVVSSFAYTHVRWCGRVYSGRVFIVILSPSHYTSHTCGTMTVHVRVTLFCVYRTTTVIPMHADCTYSCTRVGWQTKEKKRKEIRDFSSKPVEIEEKCKICKINEIVWRFIRKSTSSKLCSLLDHMQSSKKHSFSMWYVDFF